MIFNKIKSEIHLKEKEEDLENQLYKISRILTHKITMKKIIKHKIR